MSNFKRVLCKRCHWRGRVIEVSIGCPKCGSPLVIYNPPGKKGRQGGFK